MPELDRSPVPPNAGPPGRAWRLVLPLGLLGGCLGLALVVPAWLRAKHLQTAVDLLASGSYREAKTPLLEYVRAGGSAPDVLRPFALAAAAEQDDDPGTTEEVLTRWCDVSPADPEPFRIRLNLRRKLNRREAAAADAEHVVTLRPDDVSTGSTLAGLWFELGRYEEARRVLESLLNRRPDDPGLLTLHGEVLRAGGKPDEAAAVAGHLLGRHPNYFPGVLLRAVLYREAGQPEKAIPLLERLLANDPSRQRTGRYELSLALNQVGRTAEARRLMTEVRWLQDAEVMLVAGQTHPDDLRLKVRAAEPLLNLGGRYAGQGIALLDEVLRLDPSHADAHRLLAGYYQRLGRSDLADRHRHARNPAP